MPAIKAQETRERDQRDREDAAAEARLRRELAVTMREHGIPGAAERRPYDSLVERGVARTVGARTFALAVAERDFAPVPADEPLPGLWVDSDPEMPPGTHRLLGWRARTPVAAMLAGRGGVPLVVALRGRWAVPDAGTRVEWAERPKVPAAVLSERLARRLAAGATVSPRDSEELVALASLALHTCGGSRVSPPPTRSMRSR